MTIINQRVAALREWMARQPEALDAYIIPTADPHSSEYIAPHWACREWITGFNGSAGLAIVTQNEAALFTDSRYYIQAEQQLSGTPFTLERSVSVPDDAAKWATQHLNAESRIGAPAELANDEAMQILAAIGTTLASRADAFSELWTDRPALPAAPITVQDERWTGKSIADKLALIRKLAKQEGSEGTIVINDLSDVAWTLNLRGADIDFNPVFISYLTYCPTTDRFTLYTHSATLTPEASKQLADAKVEVKEYAGIDEVTSDPASRYNPATAPCGLISADYKKHNLDIASLRALKTPEEIEGMRQAHLQDGVAMVRFLRWFDEAHQRGECITELDIDRRLLEFRSERPGFEQPSFGTIAATGANAAIVHYEPTPETDTPLADHGLLLIDSGAQFGCGTTDITRTLALGELTREERRAYTLVMKGHLRLSRVHFPKGTTGLQLDAITRFDLWSANMDYGHGTGHGVGAHLCVHEGPQQLRKNLRACSLEVLQPGMTITNEPGVYAEGRFGVRIENTMVCRDAEETEFGNFNCFETLTLCPYDLRAVDHTMLSPYEVDQINDYHRNVRHTLMPLLDDEADRIWLARATAAVEYVSSEF